MNKNLIHAHGKKLVSLLLSDEDKIEILSQAKNLPKIKLSTLELSTLSCSAMVHSHRLRALW